VGSRRSVARRGCEAVAPGGGDRRQRAAGIHATLEAGCMSDRLALANAMEDAGIERSKAERDASVIFDAIRVATLLLAALRYWPLYS
jgi:hypothetical protein